MRKVLGALYTVEWLVLGGVVAAYVAFHYFGIRFRDPWNLYTPRLRSAVVCYGVGLLLSFFIWRARDLLRNLDHPDFPTSRTESMRTFAQAYIAFPLLLRDLRYLNAIVVMFVTFIQLKHLIPLINASLYDAFLSDWERSVFHGKLLSEILPNTFPRYAALIFSEGYRLWYAFIGVIIVFFVCVRKRDLREQFFHSFVLTWYLGILFIYAVPTLGPCYYAPESFSTLPHTAMTVMQRQLWHWKQHLDAAPLSDRGIFLISGFPSLHVAIAFLGTIFYWRMHWVLGFFSSCFFALTCIVTLYFGWHYVLDHAGALVLVLISMWLSTKIPQTHGDDE